MKVKMMLILLAMVTLSGCASIVAGGHRDINIKSTPTDATVSIQDIESKEIVHKGQTPLIVPLSTRGGYFKSRQYDVSISKDGYPTKTIHINSFLSGWYAGNIMLWPMAVIGGLIVDPLTGAMWSLSPKNIDAILENPEQFEERKLKEQKEKEKEFEKQKSEKENKPTVFGEPVEK
jgi:uncharacterized protein YceK